jgi:hypothetical protein
VSNLDKVLYSFEEFSKGLSIRSLYNKNTIFRVLECICSTVLFDPVCVDSCYKDVCLWGDKLDESKSKMFYNSLIVVILSKILHRVFKKKTAISSIYLIKKTSIFIYIKHVLIIYFFRLDNVFCYGGSILQRLILTLEEVSYGYYVYGCV